MTIPNLSEGWALHVGNRDMDEAFATIFRTNYLSWQNLCLRFPPSQVSTLGRESAEANGCKK